jgi:hypothetical protein
LSPCSLNREATIDAEVLIGLPGLEQLNLVIDFKGGCIRVSKSPKVVRLRTR